MKHGFTLIELLVVIAIIGILAGLAFGGYGHFIEQARKHNAAEVCSQIKTAWTNFHREYDCWPDEYSLSSSGEKKMDTDMCLVLGKAKLLDVLYLEDNSNDSRGLKSNKENEAELKVGLLSPIGKKKFDNGKRGSQVTDYLYHFVLDVNEDGIIDTSDGMPAELTKGKTIRGDCAVWCWPEDVTTAKQEGETYAQSW